MHAPILTRSPVFSKSIRFFEHHKALTLLTLLAILVIMMASFSRRTLVSRSLTSEIVSGSSKMDTPLTRLDDPHYAHEYERRAQDILTHLTMLKNQTQADRAYVVSYRDGLARFGKMVKISKTFELGQIDELIPVSHYQDVSRMGWVYTFSSIKQFAREVTKGNQEDIY